jgi:hypothetical protein
VAGFEQAQVKRTITKKRRSDFKEATQGKYGVARQKINTISSIFFLSPREASLPGDPERVFVISQFGKRLIARPVGLKRTPIAYRRQFYLY